MTSTSKIQKERTQDLIKDNEEQIMKMYKFADRMYKLYFPESMPNYNYQETIQIK